MFEKLNKGTSTIKEGIVLEDLQFVSLKDFVGSEIKVDGFFFTNGRYGEQAVLVGNGCKINMPARAVDELHQIEKDAAMLKAVMEGHLKIGNIRPVNTKNGLTTGYTYMDC